MRQPRSLWAPPSRAASSRARSSRAFLRGKPAVLLFGGLLVAGVLAAAALTVWEQRRGAVADASSTTRSLGIALAEQTELSLRGIQLVLNDIAVDVAPGRLSPAQVSAELREHASGLPQASSISLVDAAGQVTASSLDMRGRTIDVTDRDYFRALAVAGMEGLYVSAPVRSRLDDSWTVYLGRRLDKPDGGFAGLLVASLDLDHFRTLYRALIGQDGGTVTLLRRDGLQLAQAPWVLSRIGTVVQAPGWPGVVQAGGGFLDVPASADGLASLVSVHPVRGYPLVVDVGLSWQATLARWRQDTLYIALGAAAAIGSVFVLLWALIRQIDRADRARRRVLTLAQAGRNTRQRLRESELRLARQRSLLTTTLENMDQGIMLVSAENIVEVCNHRAVELLDLPEELMQSRPHFAQVLEYQLSVGEFGGDESMIAFVRGGGMDRRPQTYDRVRPNGRFLEVRSVPMEGGGIVRTYTDITERKASEELVRHSAHHDELTQLVNRVVFHQRLSAAVTAPDASFAVLYLDLDRFKQVNDTRGHSVGDALLAEVARRMRATVRATDTVARMGGDEFAIIQPLAGEPEAAAALAGRLVARLSEPYEIDGQTSVIGVSIGIAVCPGDGLAAEPLVRNADTALYRAKEAGRSTYRFFEPAMDIRQVERQMLEHELRQALAAGELRLRYRPVRDGRHWALVAFRATVGWDHPTRGVIAPDHFLPLAESCGLIGPVGRWVLQTACRDAAGWALPVPVAVPLSVQRLGQPDLAGEVAAALAQAGLGADRLHLCLSSDALTGRSAETDGARALRDMGVRIALDDFGGANANLNLLRRFPLDQITLAAQLVHGVPADGEAVAMVEAVVSLAHDLSLDVLADDVATTAQKAALERMDCHLLQGGLAGRALSPDQAAGLVRPDALPVDAAG